MLERCRMFRQRRIDLQTFLTTMTLAHRVIVKCPDKITNTFKVTRDRKF